jgi:hypothetical protein
LDPCNLDEKGKKEEIYEESSVGKERSEEEKRVFCNSLVRERTGK